MPARPDQLRQPRPARPSPRGPRLRPGAIATATLLAALAVVTGAGQAIAATGPSMPSVGGTGHRIHAHTATGATISGNDVSSRQGTVDWGQVAAGGGQFAYVKATQGSSFVNPDFAQQYEGAHSAGLVRGAYAFAIPDSSSGAAQADYFASNGGAWSPGTHTLPGALDIEYNPYGAKCYGLSQSAMVSWIGAFVNEYHAVTGRWPVIYTTTDWWSSCTGNYAGFAANDPLWIASNGSGAGALPAGWSTYTFQQNPAPGTFPGDQDVFNGDAAGLLALANNG